MLGGICPRFRSLNRGNLHSISCYEREQKMGTPTRRCLLEIWTLAPTVESRARNPSTPSGSLQEGLQYMVVSLNYCSQNGGNLYRAPYYNGNPNIGPRIIGNLDQYPYGVPVGVPHSGKFPFRQETLVPSSSSVFRTTTQPLGRPFRGRPGQALLGLLLCPSRHCYR